MFEMFERVFVVAGALSITAPSFVSRNVTCGRLRAYLVTMSAISERWCSALLRYFLLAGVL